MNIKLSELKGWPNKEKLYEVDSSLGFCVACEVEDVLDKCNLTIGCDVEKMAKILYEEGTGCCWETEPEGTDRKLFYRVLAKSAEKNMKEWIKAVDDGKT